MILIDNQGQTHPAMNLALEEYALQHLDLNQDHLLFYVNDPAIIIGKHQNTHEEINSDYVQQSQIHVVRRISGGGAVYHDHGNLNFSILTHTNNKVFNDYLTFTKPVIDALHTMGVNAELTGRNDIVVDNKKISGNAQYRRGNKMFCHGTLLFNSNIDAIVSALKVKADKIESKGVKSIRSRVANIAEFLKEPMDISDFKLKLTSAILENEQPTIHQFSKTDWQAIRDLAEKKYTNWDWNYGKSPAFNVQHRERIPQIGEIDIRLNIKQGKIEAIKIYGDFFAANDVEALERLFIQQPYDKTALNTVLENMTITNYFPTLTNKAFLELLF